MKFFHRIPGSLIRVNMAVASDLEDKPTTVVVDVAFGADGYIETDDIVARDAALGAAVVKYLKNIANKEGTGVTTDANLNPDAAAEKLMKDDVKKSVEDAQTKLVAAGIKP